MDNHAVVCGEILWPPGTPLMNAVTVRVQIEEVSRSDASAQVVGQQVQRGVDIDPHKQQSLDFRVVVDQIDDRADYTVRVHIDVNNTGAIAIGDLLSMQSHPVLTHGRPTTVRIPVQPVR